MYCYVVILIKYCFLIPVVLELYTSIVLMCGTSYFVYELEYTHHTEYGYCVHNIGRLT